MDKKETKRKKKLDKKHKHYSKISFQRKYQEKFLGSRGLKLAKLYEPKNFWIQVLLVTFLSIVVAFFIQIFVKNTGLYNVSFRGILEGAARLTNTLMIRWQCNETVTKFVYNLIYWFSNFLLNIPFIIFGYVKLGKRFATLSIIYGGVCVLSGFAFSFIPNIDNVLIFWSNKRSRCYLQ